MFSMVLRLPMKRRVRPIALLVGLALASATSARLGAQTLPTSVTETHVRTDGLVGELFLPPGGGRKLPAVIVLGGSEGGLGAGGAVIARLIADRGYAALQLGYFGGPGLPPKLERIPLEYFLHAVDWLASQPEVDAGRIGLVGGSIGAEAALVVAADDLRIHVVVAGLPSSVVWPGIDPADPHPPSTFTLAGQPLADLPYGSSGAFHGIYALYADGLKALPAHPEAVIPAENINGPVMLVCGLADTLWPSCPMADQIADRLRAKGFSHRIELLEYADAGHAAFGPPLDPARYANDAPELARLGGGAEGNNAARKDSWPRLLAFLDQALKPTARRR
jgi:dienelactone hydrolase